MSQYAETPTQEGAREYRKDIDGLRAVAVLAVIAFHARESILPGGFVGVDIFFVISGYLISKHIVLETSVGSFSLVEFYRRRIRRITPMMLTVVATVLTVAFLVMTPEETRAVAKSAFWSVLSLANVHFWRDLDTSYFANGSSEVPLLHLWSLGVEEQFYILWPLVLVTAAKWMPRKRLLWATGSLALLSFFAAGAVFPRDPMFAYYLLPTRAGELLLGAFAGIASAVGLVVRNRIASHVMAVAGALLVVISLFAIDRHDAFPGWLALPPTLGAMLLIMAGESEGKRFSLLVSRPMVYIGALSYSAYLWHWPLFAFYRYCYGEPSGYACLLIIAVTMALAWLSYRFIERHTRATDASFRSVAWRQYVLPGALVVAPALLVVYGERMGLQTVPSEYAESLASVRERSRPAYSYPWICQRQRLAKEDLINNDCVVGTREGAPVHLLLWGDSFAAQYVPMIREFAMHAGFRFRNIAVGSCPPMLVDPAPYVDARRAPDCRHSGEIVERELGRFEVIALAAAWTNYMQRSQDFLPEILKQVEELTKRGHRVLLIGRISALEGFERNCAERALRVPFKSCPELVRPIDREVERTNDVLRDLAKNIPNVFYFDANRWLCPQNTCRDITLLGAPKYFDPTHLTVAGAQELGQLVVRQTGVPAGFIRPEHLSSALEVGSSR